MLGQAAYNSAIQEGLSEAAAQTAYDTAYQVAMQDAISQALGESFTSAAKAFAQKWVINEALGLAVPAETGTLSISSEGMNSDGLGESMRGLLADIAPKTDNFGFSLFPDHSRMGISARNGYDYIPRDNFRINAHEGEAVLPKSEAAAYRAGKGFGGDSPELIAEIRSMREEMRAGFFAIAKNTNDIAKLNKRWELGGMPAVRVLV
jgi:hypothetical protein